MKKVKSVWTRLEHGGRPISQATITALETILNKLASSLEDQGFYDQAQAVDQIRENLVDMVTNL